jgi:hypothetical protein
VGEDEGRGLAAGCLIIALVWMLLMIVWIAGRALLCPGEHDVFLVRVPQEYFDDPVASEAMNAFAEFIQKTAKRPVLIVTEGKEDVALADLAEKLVEARRRMGLEQPPQIAVPRPKIHLPGGVQI